MLSQNQVKHITALRVKKYREEFGQFLAEGSKLVAELIGSGFSMAGIYASSGWIVDNLALVREKNIPVFETMPREMERITALSTPSPVLAVVNIPTTPLPLGGGAGEGAIFPPGAGEGAILPLEGAIFPPGAEEGVILALDDIRDPGNLGTIIRIADWFGIRTALCSETCVDLYNPKVVQATMGSIARVKVIRGDLAAMLSGLASGSNPFPVYGALLDGESLYSQSLTGRGIILIGNESRGISRELLPLITHPVSIPSFGNSPGGKAESLNASIATAIICAEFRRQELITDY